MNFSPFSCPIFLGHPKARGRCSQGERVLYGRDLCCSGGTEKAEAAKLPGAGIGPKPCPGKCAKEDQTHESDDSGENVESTSAYSVQGKHLWDRTALHSTAACRVSFVVNTI